MVIVMGRAGGMVIGIGRRGMMIVMWRGYSDSYGEGWRYGDRDGEGGVW